MYIVNIQEACNQIIFCLQVDGPLTGGLIGSLWYIQLKLEEIQVILIVVTIIILTESTTTQRIHYIVLIQ